MIDDYETMDYKQHYDATKKQEQRLKELEKKVRALNNLVRSNNLI